MSNYTDYFAWQADGGWIRVSARALIFNRAQDHLLIEKNVGVQNEYLNFIGGGVEIGETLQECIERELQEEALNVNIVHAQYRFVLENFIPYRSEVRHSLEHYFEIELAQEDITPKNKGVEFIWMPINALNALDLRPATVRDVIIDGTFRQLTHMILDTKDVSA